MSTLTVINPDAFLEEKRALGWFISDEERFLDPCHPLGGVVNCTEYHLESENGYEGILFVAVGENGFVEADFTEFEVGAEFLDSEYFNNFGQYED